MADHTLIFYYPRNREEAERLAADMGDARVRSLKGWKGEIEEPASRVVVDNAAPHVAEAYADAGAAVDWLFGSDADPDVPPIPDDPMALPPGYRLEHRAPWYTVIGPDGEKVGKSQRKAADAVAQVTA